MSEFGVEARGYIDEMSRSPGGRQPATVGEIWASEYKRAGLDTIGGVGQPFADARNDLVAAIEAAAGMPIESYAAQKYIKLGAGVTPAEDARLLGQLADTLPEDKRKAIDPLKDIRLNAAKKAQKIEADADDVAGATYNLSGVATSFLAGMARQAVDPVNIGAMIATAPFGGSGSVLTRIAIEGAANAAAQAMVEPIIEPARAQLGLEAGWGRAAGNIGEAFVGGVALSGLFHGAAWGLRQMRGGKAAAESASALKPAEGGVTPPEPKNAPDPVSESPGGIAQNPDTASLTPTREIEHFAPEDLTAAAALVERDHIVDAMAPKQSADAVHAHAAMVGETVARIDTTVAVPPPAPEPPLNIAADIAGKLRDIGMNDVEVRANAAIVAARYETRAQRLGLTSADLYRGENLSVRRGGDIEMSRIFSQLSDDFSTNFDGILKSIGEIIGDTSGQPVTQHVDMNARQWDLYHGTGRSGFEKFEPNVAGKDSENGAIFFSPLAAEAGSYAHKGSGAAGVYRVKVDPGKTRLFDLREMFDDPAFHAEMLKRRADVAIKTREGWPARRREQFPFDAAEDARNYEVQRAFVAEQKAYQDGSGPGWTVPYNFGAVDTVIAMARRDGLDTAVIRGLDESGGGDQIVVLNPGRVFSHYSDRLLYQAEKGRIGLADSKAIIQLFDKADASTFMHEAGHLWLDEMVRDAVRAGAPAQIKSDLDATLKWLGVDSVDAITTKHHEQWARGFEEYLREGRAPSASLGRVFQQFKDWLTAIYNKLTDLGPDHVKISDEVRGVMDRLLATDDDIAARAGSSSGDPRIVLQEFISGQRGVKVEDLHVRATNLQPEINRVGTAIADEIGAKFVDPGPKKLAALAEKVVRKQYEDASQITDAARAGLLVDNPAQAEAIVAGFAKSFDVIDEGWVRTPLGYSDRKLLIRADDGTIAEIQIIPTPMYAAKRDGGQDLYTKERSLPASPEKLALQNAQRALYSAASATFAPEWTGIFDRSSAPKLFSNRARQSASDITAAELNTSEASAATHGLPGDSTANAAPSGSSTAGRQSQLQNVKAIDRNIDPNSPVRKMGDAALAADAQRALDDAGGDMEITLLNPDGTTRTLKASDALREVEDDARAAAELQACITGAVEDGS